MQDAVIIGAGLAGCSLAIRLSAQGWKTVLIDRQYFPRHKPCGEFLSPEARETLASLGVAEDVERMEPNPIHRARLVLRHGQVLEAALPGTGWGISRYTLDAGLHRAAREAGVEIRDATTVTSIHAREDGGGYIVGTRTGGLSDTLEARTVIAAWGCHRRPDLIDYEEMGQDGHAYIGIKTHMTGLAGTEAVELYLVPGGYIGIAPVEAGTYNVAALLRRDRLKGAGVKMKELLDFAASGNPLLARRLSEGTPTDGTMISTAPVYLSRRPQPWRMIPHAGDACAMIPPLFGDGMSAALRSGILCASFADRYLRGELSMQDWERLYTEAVHREFSGILRKGRYLQAISGRPSAGRILSGFARLFPPVADSLVKATRLKNTMS